MTILFNVANNDHEQMKKVFIKDLLSMGMRQDKKGKSIHEMDYYELRAFSAVVEVVKL